MERNKDGFVYRGQYTKEISFPLGGIGTGSVGLSGNGRLIDFEIMDRPNKNSTNGFTHFAVKAENDSEVLCSKVLSGDLPTPYAGESNADRFSGFGFGPSRHTMAGFPHFENFVFTGGFPFAHIDFSDRDFPAGVRLSAFNPFIPTDDKNSSLPAAFFEIQFHNTTAQTLTYTAALSLANPSRGIHNILHTGNAACMLLENGVHNADMPEYGNVSVAAGKNAKIQQYWFRGSWFDNATMFWQDFSSFGSMKDRTYTDTLENFQDTATIYDTIRLNPGESGTLRFVLGWYYPNCYNYWNPEKELPIKIWKNYYASLFVSASECALYGWEHFDELKEKTQLFHNALFSSTLPDSVLDAVSANISILKSPTCLRLENGEFYGFEGCHYNEGCCEGSCTHVWNYAYALPFLFPSLERSMRELDFQYNMNEWGGMSFRLQLPLGSQRSDFRPCADGQFGGIIKVYRDWKINGDDDWLKKLWPSVKKNLEYAWSEHNPDLWDPDKTGVLTGRQHHTLDMELFGPNSWLTGFYLAALKAAAEIADYLGETTLAEEYTLMFQKGKKYVEENLFNGRYFYQKIGLTDKTLLNRYADAQNYWNVETGEIKYQIGEGSIIDQVLAQWHANLCGLGEIFDEKKVRQALRHIYTHHFKRGMRNYFNPCRLYCLNDESGTVICDWEDGKKPTIPIPYAEEAMHGFEYQAAVHMIQEGMVEEGCELIAAVRNRYDGARRNPWNEIEYGSNYARSMASYSSLIAFSGFEYDMSRQKFGFNPVQEGDFRCFWSLDSGWGVLENKEGLARIQVLYGSLNVKELHLPFLTPDAIDINSKFIEFTGEVILEKIQTVTAGNTLTVKGKLK